MSKLVEAITQLKSGSWKISGEPTTELEFNEMFIVITGVREDGSLIESNNPDDFGITWAEVSAKKTELENAEPLRLLREVRNQKLAETDWVITMHKELGTNIPAAWKTYRQALRDITDTYTSLNDVVWPEKP